MNWSDIEIIGDNFGPQSRPLHDKLADVNYQIELVIMKINVLNRIYENSFPKDLEQHQSDIFSLNNQLAYLEITQKEILRQIDLEWVDSLIVDPSDNGDSTTNAKCSKRSL